MIPMRLLPFQGHDEAVWSSHPLGELGQIDAVNSHSLSSEDRDHLSVRRVGDDLVLPQADHVGRVLALMRYLDGVGPGEEPIWEEIGQARDPPRSEDHHDLVQVQDVVRERNDSRLVAHTV